MQELGSNAASAARWAFRLPRQTLLIFALAIVITLVGLSISLAELPRRSMPGPPPAAIASTGPVQGEIYRWRAVAVGGGGFVTGLASDSLGKTRVARTDVYGAYLWDAALNRWRQLVSAASMPPDDRVQNALGEGVYEIMVAPHASNRLYMALKGWVYRSDDRGAHWRKSGGGKPFPLSFDPNSDFRLYGPFIAVSPDNPDLVLFGTPNDGLWRSLDGAEHWERIASVPASADLRPEKGIQAPGLPIWFAPTRSGTTPRRILVASAGHGIFVSGDNGASFVPLVAPAEPHPQTVAQGAFAANDTFFAVDREARRAWRYRDGAWADLTSQGLPAVEFAGIAAKPDVGAVYATTIGGDAWCSSDGGTRWSRLWRSAGVGEGDPPWLRLNNGGFFAMGQVQFDPVEPGRLWAAAGTGPYFSDVGSGCPWRLPWISQARGIEELVANDAVQPPGHAPLFAAWDFGINLKPDLDSFSTSFGPKERLLIATQQIDWSPSDPAFLVTNASDTRLNCCSEDGDSVLAGYSLDGGQTWHKFPTLPQPPGTKADDPWRMSFGGIAVAADSTRNIVWEPAFSKSPFYTLDRGATWNRVVLSGEKLPLTGSFDAYWGSRKTLAADRVLPGTFYLAHLGGGANDKLRGLWRTRDGGKHWDRVFTGEIAPGGKANGKLRAVPGRAGHLFYTAGIGYGPDTGLRRSRDGGVTWQIVAGVQSVDDVAFGKAAAGRKYPAIFLSGKISGIYGIWRSVDDTATWQRVAGFPVGRLDRVSVVEADKDVFGRVYVGYTGSGWLYGEPAECMSKPLEPGDDQECLHVSPDR